MKKTTLLLLSFSLIIFSLSGRHPFRRQASRTSFGHINESPVKFLDQKISAIPSKKPRKSIIVLSSTGGGGHASVANGLCTYLGGHYDVTVINAMKTIFASVDTLGTITFGKVDGEDLYNFFLRCGWTNLIGRFAGGGGTYFNWRHSALVKLTLDYFKDRKPDLIISVMPFINAALLEACEKLDIPLLVLTNDLDTTNYINALNSPTYKKFRYTLAFDDPKLWDKIAPAKIPKEQVLISGFPLRPEFYTVKNIPELKKGFEIPLDKPIVMVFMGGTGSQASYRYVRSLVRLGMPMHIIVCLGRNERLKRNIKKIYLPEGVTMSVFGFTNKIAQLMAVSDVLITKPGPNSVCEALMSQVPMILDMTQSPIFWEKLNIDFMLQHGFAEALTNYDDLGNMLPKYFKDRVYTDSVKKRMAAFECQRFDRTILTLVNSMMS